MSTSAKRFEGVTVLVTGGAHGIGRACAMRLASEGARLAIADLDLCSAERVAGSVNQVAGGHLAVALDVTRPASVD